MFGLYRHAGSNEMIDFVFDNQPGMKVKTARMYAQFRTMFPNWRLGRVGFAGDKKVLPLQAADLIAWQTRRFVCSNEGTRPEFRLLHSRRPPFKATVKRRLMQQMADAMRDNLPSLRKEYGDERVDRFQRQGSPE
jgi:hypothetical protein